MKQQQENRKSYGRITTVTKVKMFQAGVWPGMTRQLCMNLQPEHAMKEGQRPGDLSLTVTRKAIGSHEGRLRLPQRNHFVEGRKK